MEQAQPATPEADVSDGFNFFAQVDPRLLREYEELSADFVEPAVTRKPKALRFSPGCWDPLRLVRHHGP